MGPIAFEDSNVPRIGLTDVKKIASFGVSRWMRWNRPFINVEPLIQKDWSRRAKIANSDCGKNHHPAKHSVRAEHT